MIGSVLGPRRRPRPCTALGHLACLVLLGISPSISACAGKQADPAPLPATAPQPPSRAAAAARAEQDRRVARLELALLEKNTQVEELQAQLDRAREEVVRAMAKLQTLASRAEAASGIAEAEVALQPLRGRSTQQIAPEAAQAPAGSFLRVQPGELRGCPLLGQPGQGPCRRRYRAALIA